VGCAALLKFVGVRAGASLLAKERMVVSARTIADEDEDV
jgi:hypothetical protein